MFATGGFTHDPELRKNFLHGAVYGGCAAPTNEGDFVRISSALDVQLRNMNYSWMAPISLDKAIAKDGSLSGIFTPTGDSMLYVNKYGKRVVNEKLAYNEVCATFSEWDGAKGEYPNLTLISIWDQQAQDHCASDDYGSLIVPKGIERPSRDCAAIRCAELAAAIRERLAKYKSAVGGMDLSDDFLRNLDATIKRFNGFAKTGADPDFHRGERIVEKLFNGPVSEEGGPEERDDVSAEREGAVLRGADRRRQSRYQGRPEDQFARTGARCTRHTDQGAVWRRQLRRVGVGARLLGGRRHARADHRFCVSCGAIAAHAETSTSI